MSGSPRSTCNSRETVSFPPQRHAHHEILPCMLEEALLCCSISKESAPSLLKLKRVLDMLYEIPEVSPDTVPTREVHCFQPEVKKSAVLPSSIEMRVDCPASPGKECRRPHRTSRVGWNLLDTGGEPGGLSQFESHVFPHSLGISSDSLAPIRMSAENQITT